VTGTELCFLTIAEAGRLMKAKKLSPVELTEAYLARIDALDSRLDSYITVTAEQARKDARAAEKEIMAGRYRGAMHGIPYGPKDIIDTKDIPTTSCSKLDADRVPTEDATCVAKLKEAGAVLLGKLSCQEFASNGPCFDLPWPPSRNPWNRNHSPGGSSSGSGAAVAAGLAMGALGTDTGGSIRNPSSLCGIAGLKPTYGRVSRRGVITNSWTLDHVGPMCWTAEDCALMLGPMSGYDPEDPGSADEPVPDFTAKLGKDLKGVKIGLVRRYYEEQYPASDEIRAAMNEAVRVFRSLGAIVEEAELPPLIDYILVRQVIGQAEFYAVHEKDFQQRFLDYGRNISHRNAYGGVMRAVDYIQAQRKRLILIRRTTEVLKSYDALLMANHYGPAPLLEFKERGSGHLSLTGTFNMTGHPSLAICNGFTQDGFPLSMQIIANYFDEASAFRVGHAFEQATTWRAKHPLVAEAVA
jgi:aspartyl-tRNA(Asn)/glutamyl-tRNA(Gln) amidotransferase subunit A